MRIEINVNIEAKGLEAAILKLASAFDNIGIGFEVEQCPANKVPGVQQGQTVRLEKPELTFMPEDVQEVTAPVKEPLKTEETVPVQEAKPEPVKEAVAPAMPVPDEPAKKAVTRQELFTRCTQLVQGKKVTMDFMTKALQKFGAVSLPALTDEQVPLFWEELDKAGV